MQQSYRKKLAFSLIELMVVITIIGILAGIATPIYRDYTIKAKINEGFSIIAAKKKEIADLYAENGWGGGVWNSGNNSYGPEYISLNGNARCLHTYRLTTEITYDNVKLGLSQPISNSLHIYYWATDNNGILEWQCRYRADFQDYMPSNICTATNSHPQVGPGVSGYC